ncbi:hypothetical protein L1987_60736 [Smallanthus sonchifolius]|uniref:Uncharacterized protein n=1 Tax=Smallanthus sonchifolius TaxID=185202 RepID=A0ACB9D8T8_9ASTR|nr:hypothetical protein L1987_60736 [Smallanthus sonchifolius]
MDLTTFVIDYNLSFPLFALSTIIFILLIVKQTKPLFFKNKENLPPGPPRLPIIGNLHQIAGDRPHVSIASFAKNYGPLISLRFGKQLVVVASSPEAAMGILKTQDHLLSSRVVPVSMKQAHLLPHSLMWSECNQTWKTLRTLCQTELFSGKSLEAHSILRNEKLSQLLDFLRKKQGQVINIEDVVFITLFNTLSSIIFGKDLLDLNDEHGTHNGLKESLHKLLELSGSTIDLGSFYPMLERFDLNGIRRGTMKQFDKIFSYWEDIIEERRARVNSSSWSSGQAHSFLDRLLENNFSNNQINQLITELFIAGTNTTTSMVIWTMSELVRHQQVMSKIEQEMKKEINSHEITNFQLSKLNYLQACIKEAFRLQPPVPLLLPHMAVETCEVMNYKIPKNSKVFVNVWAMGRDSKIWDEPLSFKPERFMDSRLDFKGQNFELIPFGSGRRMCPGLPSGVVSLEFILASLIREFDWALPDSDDPLKLDMNGKFGMALKRVMPLKLIFKQKQAYQYA